MTYAEVMLPPRWTIGGYRLRPMTIGHALVLDRLESRFVIHDRGEPGAGDVALLIWVCGRPWRWAWWLAGTWYFRRCLRRAAAACRMSGSQATAQAIGFLKWSFAGPEELDSGTGERLQSPPFALLKVGLMTTLGVSETEALDTPVARAVWDMAVAGERKGEVKMGTHSMRGLIRVARDMARREFGRG